MKDTLHTIQTFARLGRVLSRIAYILALIGCIACAVSLLLLPLGSDTLLRLGGITLYGPVSGSVDGGLALVAVALGSGLLLCLGEAIPAWAAQRYFRRECAAGTPFTADGARELLRLGILTAAVPVGSVLLTQILQGVAAQLWAVELDFVPDVESSVLLGLLFLALSLLCRYGAELTENAA